MTIEIYIVLMMENAKLILLHFTLELEGLKDLGSLNGWTNLDGGLHGMHCITNSWSIKVYVNHISNKWVQHKTLRPQHFGISQPLICYHTLCRTTHLNKIETK